MKNSHASTLIDSGS